jgi:hypothetical protein
MIRTAGLARDSRRRAGEDLPPRFKDGDEQAVVEIRTQQILEQVNPARSIAG